jgi:hypothetical protein
MKAIETEYRGYRFRSRLEARWAVFFDACRIEWEYEPEGYELTNGTRYLPDFWLPKFHGGIFVEVKPKGGDFTDEIAVRSVADQTGHQFLILDSPVVTCRAYALLSPFAGTDDGCFDTDVSWCMSAKYLGSKPHDGAHRFYVFTGASDRTATTSGTCVACDGQHGIFPEEQHFGVIRSMRFERGVSAVDMHHGQ